MLHHGGSGRQQHGGLCACQTLTRRRAALTLQMPLGWAPVSGTVQTWLAVTGRTPDTQKQGMKGRGRMGEVR